MSSKGKKYVDAAKRFDRTRTYGPGEALGLVQSLAHARFDESVEMAVRLGIDPRKADQVIRGTVALPSGTGKPVRVAVFAAGPAAEEARAAGADVVGADDLVARVDGGFMDFDVAIATPELMGQVGRLGRKLGPRGLMPNPKTGTVTADVGKAVTDFKGGRVEYRADTRSRGVVQVPIGKVSFTRPQLLANFRAVIDEVQRAKPAAAKGRYIKSVAVSSTMGPGVDVDPAALRITDEDLAEAG
jgi:large subunit ribosomal protein L1